MVWHDWLGASSEAGEERGLTAGYDRGQTPGARLAQPADHPLVVVQVVHLLPQGQEPPTLTAGAPPGLRSQIPVYLDERSLVRLEERRL